MTKSYAYDSIGNITSKSDVGGYTYGKDNASPHALTTAIGRVTSTTPTAI